MSLNVHLKYGILYNRNGDALFGRLFCVGFKLPADEVGGKAFYI